MATKVISEHEDIVTVGQLKQALSGLPAATPVHDGHYRPITFQVVETATGEVKIEFV
jgi:hypothetical protein